MSELRLEMTQPNENNVTITQDTRAADGSFWSFTVPGKGGIVKLREDALTALQDTPSNSPFIVSAPVAEGTEDDNIVSQYMRNSVQNVNRPKNIFPLV